MGLPFAWAMIQLDGADGPFAHLLGEVALDEIRVGQRVKAVWVPDDGLAIVAEPVKVQVEVEAGTMSHRALTFRVEGLLWAQPVPEQIYLRTKLDLETGHVTLADFGVRGSS